MAASNATVRKLDRQLYDAVKAGKSPSAIDSLLDRGADPYSPVGKGGRTAVQRADEKKYVQLGTLLSTKGASSSATLRRSNTLVVHEGPKAAANRQSPTDIVEGDDDGETADTASRESAPSATLPRPAKVPMSRLASGAGKSFRLSRSVRGNEWAVQDDSDDEETTDEAGAAVLPAESQAGGALPAANPDVVAVVAVAVGGTSSKGPKRDWEFDRAKLRQEQQLGSGQFGVVFRGVATGICLPAEETAVAVKMLSDSSPDVEEDFFKEVAIMQALDGPHNIVRLLGICTGERPFLMIMELMDKGDLKTVLRDARPEVFNRGKFVVAQTNKDSEASSLSFRQLLLMGADIAEGMSYLASHKIVHRDLAARNCLVNSNLAVKVGDFGLTRDVDQGDYYRMTGSTPLPVRWMAPEALMDGMYTSASDVWSFGVVLWELVTFAKLPYGVMSNHEVCEMVTEQEYVLPQPKACPKEIYDIMKQCWVFSPVKRTTFPDLQDKLLQCSKVVPEGGVRSAQRVSTDGGASTLPPIQSHSSVTSTASGTPVYYTRDDVGDSGNAGLYSSNVNQGLSSFQLAVAMAADANAIEEPVFAQGSQARIETRHVSEEFVEYAAPAAPAPTKVKAKPVYGGATTWSTTAPTAAPSIPLSTSVKKGAAASPVTSAIATPATAVAAPTPQTKSVKSASTAPPPSPVKSVASPAPSPAAAVPAASSPKSLAASKRGALVSSSQAPGAKPGLLRNEIDMLANDNSETAQLAKAASSQTTDQLIKGTKDWIEAELTCSLGDDFHLSLKSGDVLCRLINHLKPGSVIKFNEGSRMAFKQMENIGWFLDRCRECGVLESDLFMTIDLFEGGNLRQVALCVSALRKRLGR